MDGKLYGWLPAFALGVSALLVAGCLGDPPRAGAACPADPKVEPGSQGEIELSWEPVFDAERYLILRSEPGLDPTLVANVSAANTTYVDPSAAPGTTYRYAVHSWNGTARSTDCPLTEVTAVPYFPGLAATVALGGLAALAVLGLDKLR